MTDLLLITPNNATTIYQKLSEKYSAIETPTWSLLLAESCRSIGFKVKILDCLAENLNDEESYNRIQLINPKVLCFVVYGQNVNAGTTNMSGAVRLSNYLKDNNFKNLIGFIGSHVQALPKKTLESERSIDYVFINEGVYALRNILKLNQIDINSLKKVKGLAVKDDDGINFTGPEQVVPNERMDLDLPGYAWDLLPYKEKPLDLYRSPFWHAEYKEEYRSPYAAIQTSLGCQFKCSFCMINIVNKNDVDTIGIASNYNKMRFWSTNFIIKQFDKLFKLGCKTIRITDEMFLLNRKYYIPLCEELKKRNENDDFKIWAYSRIDTVKKSDTLKLLRSAGIKWLCLGIESGDIKVRLEVSKGKFEDIDVRKIIKEIESCDINVMANYIYGLPGDTKESIQKTFELSKDLCTLGWNTYAAMALPGSQLYYDALKKKLKLPEKYEEFSFHAYETIPLSTDSLKAHEILKERDNKYLEYFNNEVFLEKIKKKFGKLAVRNIKAMNKIKLRRKIIEDQTLGN